MFGLLMVQMLDAQIIDDLDAWHSDNWWCDCSMFR